MVNTTAIPKLRRSFTAVALLRSSSSRSHDSRAPEKAVWGRLSVLQLVAVIVHLSR